MSRLMNAIEGMGDEHIKEFAFELMPQRTTPVWVKVCSLAASLVVIVLTITLIVSKTSSSDIPANAYPLVIFNDTIYAIAADEHPTYDLPEGYVYVGEVTSNNRADSNANGYSSGCHVGDKIYQNPTDPQDVFVRTTLFSGDDQYWYIRFVNRRAQK